MAEAAAARSALEGLHRPGRHGKAEGAPGVTLAELQGIGLASVIVRKGKAAQASEAAKRSFGVDLPETPRRAEGKGIEFLWAGPGQWLALSRDGLSAGELEARLAPVFAGLASVAEQSDGRTVLRIAGPKARDVLAKGLPIDLHPRAFRPGDTALTVAALIGAQIWQVDEVPTYELAVFRGFALSFWHFLTESAAEYGWEIR
ncbi:MAG TPA: sarcosine oxidase subunit gamma family protein [Candidatus Udaeobacter sp.]|nr:sarcosine oxidase subunit gamma family protein [Candidatus Udaeobacter sp.]